MEDCVRKYGLAAHLRFHQEVVSAEFDRARGLWKITTADGQERHARPLVTACGQLNRPATPKLKGIENFRGTVIHSARWDHDYELGGKSVAVMGHGDRKSDVVGKSVSVGVDRGGRIADKTNNQ